MTDEQFARLHIAAMDYRGAFSAASVGLAWERLLSTVQELIDEARSDEADAVRDHMERRSGDD
jgi:hypothetical protein